MATPITSEASNKVEAFFVDYNTKTFVKGETIIQAGIDPPGIFYLVEGRVNQYEIATNGNSVVVNMFKPHAYFPMSWAINKTPNRYFFEAATNITTRLAPAKDVVHFLQTNPDVLFDLLARVYRGTDGVLLRMAHLMGGDAKSRLLFELLNAAYRFGKPQSDGVLIALNEGDIANQAGMSRETVSRTLRGLKADGLIAVTKGSIVIKDLARLEATLGPDL